MDTMDFMDRMDSIDESGEKEFERFVNLYSLIRVKIQNLLRDISSVQTGNSCSIHHLWF